MTHDETSKEAPAAGSDESPAEGNRTTDAQRDAQKCDKPDPSGSRQSVLDRWAILGIGSEGPVHPCEQVSEVCKTSGTA